MKNAEDFQMPDTDNRRGQIGTQPSLIFPNNDKKNEKDIGNDASNENKDTEAKEDNTADGNARRKIERVIPGPGSFLGSIILQGEELSDLVDNRFATTKIVTLTQDYDRDIAFQRNFNKKNEVTIRGGLQGARAENERVFTIESVCGLNLYGLLEEEENRRIERLNERAKSKNSLGSSGSILGKLKNITGATGELQMKDIDKSMLPKEGVSVDVVCTVIWNKVEIGRTKAMASQSGNIVFRNEHLYVPLTIPVEDEDTKQTNFIPVDNSFKCSLEIEVCDNFGGSLGVISLDGKKTGLLLETANPTEHVYDLSVSSRVSGRGRSLVQAKIQLSSPGLNIVSPYLIEEAREIARKKAEEAIRKRREKEEKAKQKAAGIHTLFLTKIFLFSLRFFHSKINWPLRLIRKRRRRTQKKRLRKTPRRQQPEIGNKKVRE